MVEAIAFIEMRQLIHISRHRMQIAGYAASRRNRSDKVSNADNSVIFRPAADFAALALLTPGTSFGQRLLRVENAPLGFITNSLY
ncbi:hypothetical protein EOA23_07915 [Mesorhizobium sp. M2A.F.Ca.ET.042.01.1.1]|uniref:hypothetical protein n=1 Tax=Mesorhizobium sp. M2A.F.Ca.ET.042.01.1.1 TaxID=2496745 RepID=UPI000FCB55A1|nr:hypothetical protein [Mesorhizobium sp. M2A.F.Ca.ET.042.01.1.1]RUX33142.1 hypothetical protein EOA23_07915 [Mesorhizobium sp. M2A.F.Ca.ET.042.01.1.1]